MRSGFTAVLGHPDLPEDFKKKGKEVFAAFTHMETARGQDGSSDYASSGSGTGRRKRHDCGGSAVKASSKLDSVAADNASSSSSYDDNHLSLF